MMIISDIHKFIFIHVPKCAVTSIRSTLFQHETRNNYYWYHHQIPGARDEDPKLLIDKAYMPLAIMKRFFPSEFSLLLEYTTFATSRHPRRRIVSGFFETRKNFS